MRWPPTVLAVLALLAPFSQLAAAVNPLDDDAASGGDAGDTPSFATPLLPGRHSGALTPPVDLMDVYVFEGRQGQVVEIAVEGAFLDLGLSNSAFPLFVDSYFFLFPPDGGRYLLPADGPWFIALSPFPEEDVPPPTQHYRLSFDIHEAVTGRISRSEEGWHTMEAGWDKATDIVVQGRLDLSPRAGSSPTTMIGFEVYDDQGVLVNYVYHHFSWSGLGDEVEVASVASVPIEPPVLFADGSSGHAWAHWAFAAVPGSVRLIVYQTSIGSILLTFLADVPAVAATASGGGVHRRTLGDFAGGLEVHSPALSVSDGDEWTAALHDHALAYFSTLGSGGWYDDPAGRRTEVPGSAFLRGVLPGTWTFHVDGIILATVMIPNPIMRAPMPDALAFDGASLKKLGIAG